MSTQKGWGQAGGIINEGEGPACPTSLGGGVFENVESACAHWYVGRFCMEGVERKEKRVR